MPRGKKQCPSCEALLGVRTSTCDCGYVFPEKKKDDKPKINKKEILKRLVSEPSSNKRMFYMREMKMLNDLCERYSLEFMNIMTFFKKLDSLSYLVSPKLKDTLDQKFRAFNYSLDKNKYPEYPLGEKIGDDKPIEVKNKTIKDFLNE